MEIVEVVKKSAPRNPLEEAQVRRAVTALQAYLEKQRGAEKKKHELLAETEYISCIITRKTVPAKAAIKPLTIDVPHSLFGAENDAEMCLFVKDSDKDRIKQALAADPVPGLTKVMAIKKLRKNFKQFEDRRTLAGAYEVFLADDRILPYLKSPLGTKFFVKKKQPIAVRVSRSDVSNAVRAVFRRTAMHVSAGACTNVKIAHFGLSLDQIVENIVTGMNNAAAHIPKGWQGIQSISIKTNDSIALPIYNALADMAKLPPVASKKNQLKRKLDEVEVVATPEVTKSPVAKKAKKEAKKEEPKKEAKKEEPKKEAKKEAKKETKKEEAKKDAKKEVKKEEPKKETKKEAKKEVKKEEPKKETNKEAKKEVKKEAKKEDTKKDTKKEVKKEETKKETKKEVKKEVKKEEPKKEAKKEVKKEVKKETKKEAKKEEAKKEEKKETKKDSKKREATSEAEQPAEPKPKKQKKSESTPAKETSKKETTSTPPTSKKAKKSKK